MVRGEPELATLRFTDETRFEIGFGVSERHAPCPIDLQPSQIQSATRAERQAFDPVVAREYPARPSHMKLPRCARELSQRVHQLFHLTRGDERVSTGGPEGGREVRAPQQQLGIGRHRDDEAAAGAVPAAAVNVGALRAAAGARRGIGRLLGDRGTSRARQRCVAGDFVIGVQPLIADGHLQERPRGRDGIHRDQSRQPPAAGPQAVIDGEKPDLDPDRLDETRDVIVLLVGEVLLEVERASGPYQRADDRVRVFIDPEGARHQAKLQPSRDHAQLTQADGPTVGEYDDARISRCEPVIALAVGCEGMAEFHPPIFGGIAIFLVSKPDRQTVVGGIERIVSDFPLHVLGDLRIRDGDRHGFTRTQHLDAAQRITPPLDPQRELAPVEQAIAAQRPNADADPLAHGRLVGRDRPVDRLAAGPRGRDEPPRLRIEVRGAVTRGAERLHGEDGGNEKCCAHVGLCTEPSEG